jgi:hypothetical protein
MSKYANKTIVSPEKSITEIQTLLKKYNASRFGYIYQEAGVVIGFEMLNKRIRFCLPLPTVNDCKTTPQGKIRNRAAAEKAQDQLIRQRWRALLLAIKAKLESIESGIETFEEAFLAHIVLPNGQTMAEWATPQIESSYKNEKMPPLLGHDS